jgi:hypothetical protein
LQSPETVRTHRTGAIRQHLGSRGYLEFLDQRLGFSRGTLYDLCLAAAKSKKKTGTKNGVKVTYRGESEREMRTTSHHSALVQKTIFLIEYRMMKAGEPMDRVIQVHLEK